LCQPARIDDKGGEADGYEKEKQKRKEMKKRNGERR
jgi:hypothetical protein